MQAVEVAVAVFLAALMATASQTTQEQDVNLGVYNVTELSVERTQLYCSPNATFCSNCTPLAAGVPLRLVATPPPPNNGSVVVLAKTTTASDGSFNFTATLSNTNRNLTLSQLSIRLLTSGSAASTCQPLASAGLVLGSRPILERIVYGVATLSLDPSGFERVTA